MPLGGRGGGSRTLGVSPPLLRRFALEISLIVGTVTLCASPCLAPLNAVLGRMCCVLRVSVLLGR